jgi:hypothetical protein
VKTYSGTEGVHSKSCKDIFEESKNYNTFCLSVVFFLNGRREKWSMGIPYIPRKIEWVEIITQQQPTTVWSHHRPGATGGWSIAVASAGSLCTRQHLLGPPSSIDSLATPPGYCHSRQACHRRRWQPNEGGGERKNIGIFFAWQMLV